MPQEQFGSKILQGIGLVAAFGLLTMSSNVADSITTMSNKPAYYCDAYSHITNENTICNSSLLSKMAIGDIFANEKKADFGQPHKRISVTLEIAKIARHISNFDFEEEYEEI